MAREIPAEIQSKYSAWRFWTGVWNAAHYVTGFGSAALSAMIATNVKSKFLEDYQAIALAAIAAGLTSLITAFGAQSKAKAFEMAARRLEVAKIKYQFDSTIPDTFLTDAVAEGVSTLEGLK